MAAWGWWYNQQFLELACSCFARVPLGTVTEKSVAACKVLTTVGAEETLFVAVGSGDVAVAVVLADKPGVAVGIRLAPEWSETNVGADVRVDSRLAHKDTPVAADTFVKAAAEILGLLFGGVIELRANLVAPAEASVDDGFGRSVHEAFRHDLDAEHRNDGARRGDGE